MIHTPYDGSHKPFTIGLSQLDLATWIDIDQHFDFYLQEKRRLYRDLPHEVLVAQAGTEDAQQEVSDLLVQHLAKLGRPPHQHNEDDGLAVLARAALMVQEDLVLMRKSPEGWRLVAASLCFPSAWNLREKFGKTLARVHEPVPGFNEGTRNALLIERMFDNLHPDRSVMRWNWTLFGETQLYHPASERGVKRRFGDGDIAENVTIRMERQTLRKLPQSGDILFGIKTYLDPIEVLMNHAHGKLLAKAIVEQVSSYNPAEVAYKGLETELDKLIARLQRLAN